MISRRWLPVCIAAAFFLTSGAALAQGNSDDHGHGHGHGRGHDRGDYDQGDYDHGDHGHGNHGRGDHDDYDRGDHWRYGHYYSDHERDEMHEWYEHHYRDLPPGLARRDRLPPGLERQLVVRGTLPPGLRRHMEPCPPELVRELPPPPPDCEHVIIGGHIVLLNRSNFRIVDVIHFELF